MVFKKKRFIGPKNPQTAVQRGVARIYARLYRGDNFAKREGAEHAYTKIIAAASVI